MENNNLNTIIENFIRENLYPTKQERNFISEKYQELRGILPSQFYIFQSGSYARTTANTPVNDLDIICDSENPQENLSKIFNILEDMYKWKARIKLQTHSIGIYFWEDDEFSIDIVPVKQARDVPKNEFGDYLYELPDFLKHSKRNRGEFYELNTISHSDPRGYISQALYVDRLSEWRFKKAVKFLKRWNYWMDQEVDDENFSPFKSFHIEEIIKWYYMDNPQLQVLESLEKFFCEWISFLWGPIFPDRADNSKFIDQYVTEISEKDKKTMGEFLSKAKSQIWLIKMQEENEIQEILEHLLFIWGSVKLPPKKIFVPKTSSPYFKL